VRFNHLTGEKSIADSDMLAYTRRLFSPLRHEHLFDNFPAFLRQAAAVLEGGAGATNGVAAANASAAADMVADTSAVPPALPALRRQGVTPKRNGTGLTAH
jgi:hypothetical protein